MHILTAFGFVFVLLGVVAIIASGGDPFDGDDTGYR